MMSVAVATLPRSFPLAAERLSEDEPETFNLGNLEQVVESYLPLVKYVVSRFASKIAGLAIIDYEDLLSFGVKGLIEAYYAFDPKRGNKFSTYAVPRIRGAILDALRAAHPLPRSAQRLSARIDQAITDLANDLGRSPSRNELAEYLGLSREELLTALVRSDVHVLSLDGMIEQAQNRDGDRAIELASEDPNLDPGELAERSLIRTKLREALTMLPDREQRILHLYYSESVSLKAIGQMLGLSESRICQLHNRAIRRLQSLLHLDLAPV